MNSFFKCIVAVFIFLSLICHKCYSIDDRDRPQLPMASQPQQMQNQQPPSPMPLPAPPPNINYQPPAAMQNNFGTMPAQTMSPATNVQLELPKIPTIRSSLGKVTNKGVEKNGFPWIEIKDELFNETLRIEINPKDTPIIKKATIVNYNDIKIGDTVSVVFNQQDENITANFVSIFTEEDLKAMEESLKAESSVKTENETKDNENPENLKHISE
jgi:hypothetical protein